MTSRERAMQIKGMYGYELPPKAEYAIEEAIDAAVAEAYYACHSIVAQHAEELDGVDGPGRMACTWIARKIRERKEQS